MVKTIGTTPEQAQKLVATLREALGKIKEKSHDIGSDGASTMVTDFYPVAAEDWTRETVNLYGYRTLAKWLAADSAEYLKIGLHDVLNTLFFVCSDTDGETHAADHGDTIREAFDGLTIVDRTTQADCFDARESREQLSAFIASGRLKFRVTAYPDDCQTAPPWSGEMGGKYGAAHGIRYRITISREGKPGRLSFDYWGSIKDRQTLEKIKSLQAKQPKDFRDERDAKPSAYDVFSCVSSDSTCPDSFAEFCDSFGYDRDSRKALSTFKRCLKFSRRINAFFSVEELAQLQAIQF